MEENFSFGYWLRRQRLARDIRQADLAAQLGVAAITLRKIEADERRPSLQLIERVADTFALSEDERATLLRVARADLSPAALALPERAPGADLADAPPDAGLPSGTVTFLFTDIAGSTQLWERHTEAMRAALARHDSLLRAAIARHGGAVVKGTGDGILAAFALAEDGLAAALEAQRALRSADWGAVGELSVRMAIHSGAAELEDGDYFGPTLNRAARLLATGHAGQILLSLAAAELLRDSLPATVGLRDLGTHLLKDLTRPEQIFQAVAPDLPGDFPALRSLDARRHNLPAQSTALIGREQEVAGLCALLGRPDVRMATLTGPGGTGKTRLALQAAAELIDRFSNGVWFVNLAPLSDPALVIPAIAQALDVRAMGGRNLAETLRDALRDQELLLLLDNFEQLIPAAPELAPLLAAAPRVKLLVTSREALHLSGERLVAVPPLGLPDMRQLAQGEELAPLLSQYEAVRLFIERARAVRADFAVTNANAPAVAEICVRLDGLPLAIELAAARARLFTPEALLQRLGQGLQLLTGGPRDMPARQQTLRGAIEWSYALLSAEERAFFRRLGVFVGGWGIAGAAALGQLDEGEALDMLAALVDKSLLRERAGPDGEPRFGMLETIREYALEQLERAGEAEGARERHAAHMLALAEAAAPELGGPRKGAWCDQLEVDHGNLRAALSYLAKRSDSTGLARIGAALWRFWWLRGHWREGRAWLTRALSMLPAAPEAAEESHLRASALSGLVWMMIGESDFAAAAPLAEESLRLFQGLGDHVGQAESWFGLAHVTYGQSDFITSTSHLIKAHAHYEAVGDQSNAAYALSLVGYGQWLQGELVAAQACEEQSLKLARSIGDEDVEAMALAQLGLFSAARGDHAMADEQIGEALAIHRRVGNRHAISSDLIFLGLAAAMRGDHGRSAGFQREAIDLRRALGDRRGMGAAIFNLASAVLGQGDPAEARRWNSEGLAVSRELDWVKGYQAALSIGAAICGAEGRYERAATLLGAEEAMREASGLFIEPDEEGLYTRTGDSARAALGEDAFAAAWAAGRAMSLDAALELAMAEQP